MGMKQKSRVQSEASRAQSEASRAAIVRIREAVDLHRGPIGDALASLVAAVRAELTIETSAELARRKLPARGVDVMVTEYAAELARVFSRELDQARRGFAARAADAHEASLSGREGE